MSVSESEEDSDTEAQIGGGRASVESVSEFLKEFKSARMSFEPLDTWLFVKARDSGCIDVESVSDCNNVSVSSESDSSAVYHFDSDELSSSDGDDDKCDDSIVHATSVAAAVYAVDDCEVEKPLIIKNLANSPGQSGCGIKGFNEMDQNDELEEGENTVFDVSPDYSFNSRSNVESVPKHTTYTQQLALSNICSLSSGRRVCSNDEACDDNVSATVHHENVTHRTDRCYKEIHDTCGILDKFESLSRNTCENAVDAYWHAKQNPVNIESSAGIVLDGITAECNSFDINSTGEIDVNDTLKCNNKRQRIAQELMETEATYQRHLELIVQVYILFFCICCVSLWYCMHTL